MDLKSNFAGVDYLAPTIQDHDDKAKLRWVDMIVNAGRSYLESQSGYKNIGKSRDAIMGVLNERMPKSLSRVSLNRPKRQVREIVSVLSNIRARFQYKTDNKEYYNQAQMLEQLGNAWWLNTFADRKLKEGLQYAASDGLGYIGLGWEREYWTAGRGEITAQVYSADQVLPYQIGDDHDIQKAYAVTIIKKVPIAQAHALFKRKAGLIKPDEESSGLLAKGRELVQRFNSPVLNLVGGKSKTTKTAWPIVTLRYTYVLDNTINKTSKPIKMGIAGSSWSYTVPKVGGDIFAGYDERGERTTRKATEEDAMMFPMRRLMISTSNAVLYDGSSSNWHGQVPVTPLMFDKWPWEFLPYSLIHDVMSVNASNNTIMRAIDDAQKVRLRPPMAYDNRLMSEAEAEKIDFRLEGQTLGMDLSQGDPMKPILDPRHFDVPTWITTHLHDMEQRADHQIGVTDFNALARAKQIPAGDTMEALMQAVGPLLQDMTRSLEHSVRGVGEQFKGNVLQYYTKPRIIQMQGKDKAALTEMDFDPLHMIPKFAPGEKSGAAETSNYSLTERARKHVSSFYMYIEPNSISQTQAMSQKLMYLQLFRSGFPIDPWTVADALDIEGFGAPPKGANTIYEKWVAFMRIKNEQAIESALQMQQLETSSNALATSGGIPGANPNNEAPPGVGAKGNASGVAGQAGPGRPPSGQKPPHLQAKSDGTPVIAES